MRDRAKRPTLAQDFKDINQRIRALERRPAATVVSADAGGVAWTSGNPAWIDPTSDDVPAWTELRVRNTDTGSQLWRNIDSTWRLLA